VNALAIDNPIKYACMALDGEIQIRVDAEDNLFKI